MNATVVRAYTRDHVIRDSHAIYRDNDVVVYRAIWP